MMNVNMGPWVSDNRALSQLIFTPCIKTSQGESFGTVVHNCVGKMVSNRDKLLPACSLQFRD